MSLLLLGHSNKAIARKLDLSVDTVKDHVARLMRSLNVSSRTQAVVAVTRMTQGLRPAPVPPGQMRQQTSPASRIGIPLGGE
jgi:hypothetical protein